MIVPGGDGTLAFANHELGPWLRTLHGAGRLMTSVCDGAVLLAQAGLLRGRAATAHHLDVDRLVAADPSVQVGDRPSIVDSGDVITSAGVSAGIDMALHLLDRLAPAGRAAEVAARIEYRR